MKRFFITFFACLFVASTFAVTYNKSRSAKCDVTPYTSNANSLITLGGGGSVMDTVKVNDTTSYTIVISAADVITCSGQMKYKKVGTGKPTITIKFYQSYDGVTYEPVKKGINRIAYTVANSGVLTADSSVFWSFRKDTVFFDGKYLKKQIITTNTANTSIVPTDYTYIKRQ